MCKVIKFMRLIRFQTAKFICLLAASLLLVSCAVDMEPSVANTVFGAQALHYEFIIVLISLIGGIGCLIVGIILTILGVTGSIEWIVEVSGFTSRIINASPGIVIMIIGLILTLKSRLKIKVRKHS